MLRAVSSVCARGIYVGGNTTTSTGLTVTMVKEAGAGEYVMEAGALVLADQVHIYIYHIYHGFE